MLNISKSIENGKVLFSLEGRLDTNTAPELEKELTSSLEGVSELELDFAKLDYISSAGLRVLLAAQKIMAKQGSLKIKNVNDAIMDIFNVTGFSAILTIE